MNDTVSKILSVICAVLTLGMGYMGWQVIQLQSQLEDMQVAMAKQLTEVKQSTAQGTRSATLDMERFREQLAIQRREMQAAAMKATAEAEKKAETLTESLAKEVDRKTAAQAAAVEQAKSEISAVKEETRSSKEAINQVSGEVMTVKADLTNTRTQLEQTVGQMKTITGELGGQASLIATNSREIEALRNLGQREIVEFILDRRAKEGKVVRDVRLTLTKTDPKRNRFTIQVLADDKRVEKRDRTVNEPVQFYVSGARQPYEIVVNSVTKTSIQGYLSTPKVRN